MSDMLCGPNYEVTTAPDALQGFIQARDLKPLIVISDMEMPGYGTGDVGLKDLRKDPRLRHIPFIFVTSMDQEKAKLLLPQGDPTVRLMSKPVDWVKLRAWIKEMCGLEIPERVPEAG